MASIDKIYGNFEQYKELRDWLSLNLPEALKYLYHECWEYGEWHDNKSHPISNFPESIDKLLLEICPITWVVTRIKSQYGLID